MAGAFLTDDLTAVFASSDFGEEVVIGGQTYYGHFDDGDEVIQEGEDAGVIMRVTRVMLATADVGTATDGTSVSVAGSSYTVRQRLDDGNGVSTLYLEAV